MALIFVTSYVSKRHWPVADKKKVILFVAESLMLITIAIVVFIIRVKSAWFVSLIPYPVIMGFTIWYFKFDNTVFSDESAKVAEIV